MSQARYRAVVKADRVLIWLCADTPSAVYDATVESSGCLSYFDDDRRERPEFSKLSVPPTLNLSRVEAEKLYLALQSELGVAVEPCS